MNKTDLKNKVEDLDGMKEPSEILGISIDFVEVEGE